MTKTYLTALFFIVICSFSFAQVPIGSNLEGYAKTLKNANGEATSLKDQVNREGLLIVFSCNTCPFVVGSKNFPGWEGQYNTLYDLAKKSGIGFVLVNSNEAKRDGDDSFENMEKHATDAAYKMPYLMDENSSLANSLMAKTTPHVFFYNSQFKLIYSGSIDNIWDGKRKKDIPHLKQAIQNHSLSKKIKTPTTAPKGCSIKRVKS